MPTLLSTKMLTLSQKELLLNAGLGFVEYDFITTKAVAFETPKEIKNLIFTSQNAVRFFFEKMPVSDLIHTAVFCVGEKTEATLIAKKLNVVEKGSNATELAHKIVNNHKEKDFLFICGEQRREELPSILKKNTIHFEELTVYKTIENSTHIARAFDGVLFFSPSAVQSYMSRNSIKMQHCFCIGNTTANTVAKYTNQITIANKSTIENVIVQAVKYFK